MVPKPLEHLHKTLENANLTGCNGTAQKESQLQQRLTNILHCLMQCEADQQRMARGVVALQETGNMDGNGAEQRVKPDEPETLDMGDWRELEILEVLIQANQTISTVRLLTVRAGFVRKKNAHRAAGVTDPNSSFWLYT